MDLNEMKSRLSAMQSKSSGKSGEKKSVFWKPSVGKQIVRVVPSKYNKLNPFTEMYFHYGIGKNTMVSPINWGEKDPIVEFAKQLRQTSDKENWRLAKKVEPKMRIFVPVIVRGEESTGVRLWEVGKLVNDQLMGIASDEDYGDFTDITDGRDFTVEAVEDVIAGRKGIKCTLRIKPKTSPISDDSVLVEKALEEQPDILAINRKYTYDQLKDVLQKWLSPEEETSTEATPTVASTEDEEDDFIKEINAPVQPYSLDVKPKETASDKFDSLFND